MQNLPRNRIGNEVPFLANPTLELRHDLPSTILRTILSVNKNLRTKKTCPTQSCFSDDEIREILRRIWMPVAFALTAS